jgi:hypothetical protein
LYDKLSKESIHEETNRSTENRSGTSSDYSSGSETRSFSTGSSDSDYYTETTTTPTSKKTISLSEIRAKQKEKMIEAIDMGIEPGLSMSSAGENFSRGVSNTIATTGSKYNRDPKKKKTIKEAYGPWGKISQVNLDKIAKAKKREEKEKGILRRPGSTLRKDTTNYVVKVNKLSETSVIKELTGDETGASIGDQKEGELKRVGINLKTFKAKKFI